MPNEDTETQQRNSGPRMPVIPSSAGGSGDASATSSGQLSGNKTAASSRTLSPAGPFALLPRMTSKDIAPLLYNKPSSKDNLGGTVSKWEDQDIKIQQQAQFATQISNAEGKRNSKTGLEKGLKPRSSKSNSNLSNSRSNKVLSPLDAGPLISINHGGYDSLAAATEGGAVTMHGRTTREADRLTSDLTAKLLGNLMNFEEEAIPEESLFETDNRVNVNRVPKQVKAVDDNKENAVKHNRGHTLLELRHGQLAVSNGTLHRLAHHASVSETLDGIQFSRATTDGEDSGVNRGGRGPVEFSATFSKSTDNKSEATQNTTECTPESGAHIEDNSSDDLEQLKEVQRQTRLKQKAIIANKQKGRWCCGFFGGKKKTDDFTGQVDTDREIRGTVSLALSDGIGLEGRPGGQGDSEESRFTGGANHLGDMPLHSSELGHIGRHSVPKTDIPGMEARLPNQQQENSQFAPPQFHEHALATHQEERQQQFLLGTQQKGSRSNIPPSEAQQARTSIVSGVSQTSSDVSNGSGTRRSSLNRLVNGVKAVVSDVVKSSNHRGRTSLDEEDVTFANPALNKKNGSSLPLGKNNSPGALAIGRKLSAGMATLSGRKTR